MTRGRYYSVRLGRLDHINGPGVYQFPTKNAALIFADAQHVTNPRRVVIVRKPDNTVVKRYNTISRRKARVA